MSQPTSTGVPSTGRPVEPSNASATKKSTKSTWGTNPDRKWRDFENNPYVRVWDDRIPPDDDYWYDEGIAIYEELSYVPCDWVVSHYKHGTARTDERAYGIPRNCKDPKCQYLPARARLQAKKLLHAVQMLRMMHCGELGGLSRPALAHECLKQGVLVEWEPVLGKKTRNTLRRRMANRIAGSVEGWGYVIQADRNGPWREKWGVAESTTTVAQRIFALSSVPPRRYGDFLIMPYEDIVELDPNWRKLKAPYWSQESGKRRVTWSEAHWLLTCAFLNRTPGTRLGLVGFRNKTLGEGLGAADPGAWKCPHPDHVSVVPWEGDRDTFTDPHSAVSWLRSYPFEMSGFDPHRYGIRCHGDGNQQTYLYNQDNKCLIHGLTVRSDYDSVGAVTAEEPLIARLERKGYEPALVEHEKGEWVEPKQHEGWEQVDLVMRPEDAEWRLEAADKYDRRVGELCEEWSERLGTQVGGYSDLRRVIDDEWEDDRRNLTWQEYTELVIIAQAVERMEVYASGIRELVADALTIDSERLGPLLSVSDDAVKDALRDQVGTAEAWLGMWIPLDPQGDLVARINWQEMEAEIAKADEASETGRAHHAGEEE